MAHCLSCFKPSDTLYNCLLKSAAILAAGKTLPEAICFTDGSSSSLFLANRA